MRALYIRGSNELGRGDRVLLEYRMTTQENAEPSGKKSRQQRRDERRESIKQAAITVFSEKGYHNAKVSDIVASVGVAQGTFYLYYKGKQQLFGELLNDFLAMVVETVAAWEPASLETREDLGSELTRVGLMLTEVLSANRDLTTIFFKEAISVSSEFDELIQEFHDTLAAMLTTFNTILHGRGLIEPMNFELLAYATIGQVERIISEYVVNQTFKGVEPPELVDHLVWLFLTGTGRSIPSPSKASEA